MFYWGLTVFVFAIATYYLLSLYHKKLHGKENLCAEFYTIFECEDFPKIRTTAITIFCAVLALAIFSPFFLEYQKIMDEKSYVRTSNGWKEIRFATINLPGGNRVANIPIDSWFIKPDTQLIVRTPQDIRLINYELVWEYIQDPTVFTTIEQHSSFENNEFFERKAVAFMADNNKEVADILTSVAVSKGVSPQLSRRMDELVAKKVASPRGIKIHANVRWVKQY